VLLIWIAGGLISLCGALGYAELASAYPQAGGDYVT
jgi:APA family basic amino acid/polyamine antiporter